jgi:hypothetical protein
MEGGRGISTVKQKSGLENESNCKNGTYHRLNTALEGKREE